MAGADIQHILTLTSSLVPKDAHIELSLVSTPLVLVCEVRSVTMGHTSTLYSTPRAGKDDNWITD